MLARRVDVDAGDIAAAQFDLVRGRDRPPRADVLHVRLSIVIGITLFALCIQVSFSRAV